MTVGLILSGFGLLALVLTPGHHARTISWNPPAAATNPTADTGLIPRPAPDQAPASAGPGPIAARPAPPAERDIPGSRRPAPAAEPSSRPRSDRSTRALPAEHRPDEVRRTHVPAPSRAREGTDPATPGPARRPGVPRRRLTVERPPTGLGALIAGL